jgi:hypothetical protein
METVPHFVPFFSVFSFRSVNGTERFRFLGKGTEWEWNGLVFLSWNGTKNKTM